VTATVRLLNERTFGDEADADNLTARINNSDVSLDLAYMTMKEFLYSPLTLTVGRQNLKFGNGLIIGDPDTNGISDGHLTTARYLPNSLDDLSLRKAFDAIRATLDYDPLVVDLVYSDVDENAVGLEDDTTLMGVNASYMVNNDLTTEAYLWQRTRRVAGTTPATPAPLLNEEDQDENLRTIGARAAYTGIENMTLGIEGAFQFGDHFSNTVLYPDELGANATALKNRKVTAYAIQAVANMVMPNKKYTPVIGGSYTYLSGDNYLSDSDNYHGWSAMYEDQAGGTLFNKIMGYSNAQLFNLNGTVRPWEDVAVRLDYYYLRLNKPYSIAAVAAPVTLSGVTGDPTYIMQGDKKDLGNEVDLNITYDYTEDVQLGLNYGVFMPGDAFAKNNDNNATQVIGTMKVTF
ncbi:MAG: alginate export family protein, partial [Candidatus Omnitrophica bacterium]|nr:alginate export family protein [Candidatus Omnitrophota bacterium]